MDTGFHIGAVVDKESIGAMTDAIIRIAEVKADQETIRRALDTLAHMAKVENCAISNVVVNGERSIVIDMDDATFTPRTAPPAAPSGE